MKTISYFDFRNQYHSLYPKSTYRLGQHFIHTFCMSYNETSLHEEIYNSENKICEDLIFKLINKENWDMMCLEIK